jgi:hypothetical protein
VPSGKTIMGDWLVLTHATGAAQVYGDSVSFVLPFSSTLPIHWIRENGEEAITAGEQKSTACLGTVSAPTAANGNICLYTDTEVGLSTNEANNLSLNEWKWGLGVESRVMGFDFRALSAGEGFVAAGGTWAATAP